MIQIKGTRQTNKLYANIFLSLTICIIVTMVSLSLILYMNFEKITLSNIYASEKNSLSQSSYSAKAMMTSATNYAVQIYSDPQFDKLLYYEKPTPNDINYSLTRLNTYLNMNYFFYSIYIYNKNANSFYTLPDTATSVYQKELFYDKEAVQLINQFKNYKRLTPIPRKIPVQVSGQEGNFANAYTFMFYDLPGMSSNLDHVIMLNISERWMKDTIRNLDINGQGSTFIVDDSGTLVTSTDKYSFMTNLSKESYMKKVLNANDNSGYMVQEVDGVKSLVIYSKYDPSNWIFLRVLPYDGIMKQIDSMKFNVLLVCMIILIIGLAVSRSLSRSLYKPIESMLSNMNLLAKEKRDNQFKLKQNYLSRLVHNLGEEKTHDIEGKLKEYNIQFNANTEFIILLISIDRYQDFSNKFNYKDRSLLKYAVMNIATECLQGIAVSECVEMDERTITVILNGHLKPLQADRSMLDGVLKEIQEAAMHHLQLSVSIFVSETGDSLAILHELYEEAQQLMEKKFISGYGSILYSSPENTQSGDPFHYPSIQEKSLIEVIKLGKAEEAKQLIVDMSASLKNPTYLVYNMFFSQLAYTLCTTAMTMEKSSGSSFKYDFHSFIFQLHQQETLQDTIARFSEMIDAIAIGMRDRKSSKHDHLIVTIDGIIQNDFSDPELSLYKISESIDMSPAYLGRIFKKMTMKSVPDYLNEYRMERAKEMLTGTNLSIEDISQKTGYNNSTYFYKVFKKYNGITPNEYRQNAPSVE
ncbi:AraC family transcriptional regulator [Paenibacillus sp. GCM10023252]|uniref:AraC family transcriptional regulator n=1 Tax=Paenibacillus sp. GCM10023252 TaxID=3252649 RepID=UPI0036075FEE